MAWRNCSASLKLVEAVNRRWPNRSKASDGTIGDAAHATRTSDHNPFIVVGGTGVVRARDITRSGCDLPWLFEQLRKMGAAGDPRLTGGGYLILDRRITTPNFSGWKAYKGSNPHTKHGHVSFSRNRVGFDSGAAWNFGSAVSPARVTSNSGSGVLKRGSRGDDVVRWQRYLARCYTRFGSLAADGIYGPATEAFVKKVQELRDIDVDGESGPITFRATNYA